MNSTRYIINFLIILIFSFSGITKAQDQVDEEEFKVTLKTIDQYALVSFELKNGAIFYWRNPGELGIPTKFNLAKSSNLKDYKIFWPIPDLVKKEDVSSYVYQENTNFVIQLTPQNTEKNIQLNVEVSFSICQKTCQNYDLTLTNTVVPTDNNIPGEILEKLARTPKANGYEDLKILNVNQELTDNQHWLNIEFTAPKQILEPTIYFDLPEYVHFEPAKYTVISEEQNQIIRLPFSITDSKHSQIEDNIYINLISDNGNAIEFEILPQNDKTNTSSFLWIIFCAFLGGLILNVMPCVLPILALKILQLMKFSDQEQHAITKGFIAHTAGIIFSFLIFALATYVLQFLGYKVGLGMHFQQPFYLITMTILLSLISISLISDINFNLILPDFVNRLLNKNAKNSGLIGLFISGAFTTLLAIPCTAPFVTIAVGFALTTDLTKMLIIFITMGIGMSSPYIILAIYPSLAKFLPKPGNWMNVFKKITGILIFITSLWLMYILSTQIGLRSAVILFLLIILIKFIINEKELLQKKAKAFLLFILISLCYFLPHNLHLEDINNETIVEQAWQEYRPEDIPNLIQENYIVVVDVSASWCATCSVNKLTTLNNSSVINTMKKFKLIAMRADISKHTSDAIVSLMRLKNHRGIPLTLIYSKSNPQGMMLPTILTPHILISAIKNELYH